jgi:O-antigen/teichoic acid export membrane protein
MGIAMVVVRAVETFTRPGIAQALIAMPADFEARKDTAFTLLVARGVVLTLLLMAVTPWIADFYEKDELRAILFALSATFAIAGFANINTIARQRDLDFRRLTYLGQSTLLIGTAITIAMAFWTRDVWALVVGQLAGAILSAVLSYVFVPGRLKFGYNPAVARELLGYGKFVTGSSILLYIAAEIDSATIAKVLDVEQLGFYALAFTTANLVTANISRAAASIMMPAYSSLQSDLPSLRRAYLRTMSFVFLPIFPATAGVILLAPLIIEVVYGAKWLPAALPLQILCVFGLLRALAGFSGYLFEGIGRPGLSFKLAAVRLAIVVPLIIPMTMKFGLVGAAGTVTLAMAVYWVAGLFALHSTIGVSAKQIFLAVQRSVWSTAAMTVAILVLRHFWPDNSLGALAVCVGVGMAVYGALNVRVIADAAKMLR